MNLSYLIVIEAIIKILILALIVHFIYLFLVKFAIQKKSQDMLGGAIAKFFNIWLDVQEGKGTDKQNKLMLSIHIFPASLLAIFLWPYLASTVLIISLVLCVLLILSSTLRRY